MTSKLKLASYLPVVVCMVSLTIGAHSSAGAVNCWLGSVCNGNGQHHQ